MSLKKDEAKELTETKHRKRRKRTNGFEEWGGYMAAKKSKLEVQFHGQKPVELLNEQKSDLFSGISIFVNGYTNPPADELKRLMRLHGGTYHFYYSLSKTTHIIASNLPKSKIKDIKNKIIVTAQWITDSIKAGKVLPSHEYLLYSPETKDKQKKISFPKASDCPSVELNIDFLKSQSINEPTTNSCKASFFYDYDEDVVTSPPCFESSPEEQSSPSDSKKTNKLSAQPTSGELFSSSDSKKTNKLFAQPNLGEKSPLPERKNSNHCSALPISPISRPPNAGTAFHTGQAGFLSEFYNHSRLHHISTGGQELKRYVQYLIENKKDFPGKEKLQLRAADERVPCLDPCQGHWKEKKGAPRTIMHLDMDCFFVSVGLKRHPELIGFPVAVTHSKGRRGGPQKGSDINFEATHYASKHEKVKGLMNEDFALPKSKLSLHSKEYGSLSEIASCNYEARKAGLRNGMFLGEALRRCPNLKTIPYDFESYSEVSKQLYDTVSSYTLDIEAVSVDELYIDCTELLNDTRISPHLFASTLREEILERTKCTASAGLGSNMLLARLATKVAKPNGQYHVLDREVEDFMKKQKVEDLPGVGYKTSKKLEKLGIVTCSDLRKLSLNKLQQEFGPKTGESVYNKCRGKDDRSVQVQKDRKSVSAEINYGIRFKTNEDVYQFINEVALEVQNRLQNINCKGKAVTLKLMVRRFDAPVETAKFMGHGVCDNVSKSVLLRSATDNSKVIGNECCTVAKSLNIRPQDYRGVGIQISKLEPAHKENSCHQTLKKFFNQTESSLKFKESRSPIKLETTKKPSAAEKNTMKYFLSKTGGKKAYDLTDYIPDQVDEAVLNALPDDIRKEVLENCGHVTRTSSSTSGSATFSTDANLKFINKNNEGSYLSDIKSASTSLSPLETAATKEVAKFQTLCNFNSTNNRVAHQKKVIEFFITWDDNKTHSKKQASLGGAVEIDDVRKLLKEWIRNSLTPLDEDIEELKQFLLDCIDEDLSKVTLLLKYFYRLACSNGPLWKEAYLSILSYVQQKMLQNFGAMLSVSCDFTV